MKKSFSRQKNVFYKIPGSSVNNSYNERLSYDKNGNILTLKRNGEKEMEYGTISIDNLDYDYDGNRLINVTDKTNHSLGFNDGNKHVESNENDFEYDDYGNMVIDRNKEITNITYNHLNLPKKITFENNQSIEYLYAADGSKLKKTITDGSTNKTVDYLDGFQYEDEKLEFFPTAEGYVQSVFIDRTGFSSFHYIYTYTDHLGNIRLKYTKHPRTGDTQILEENNYYPFGLEHTGYDDNHEIVGTDEEQGHVTIIPVSENLGDSFTYKFGGKELQDELGLDWHDFGARNYQADLGRFFNIDRYAENFMPISTYQYAANNPISYIDYNGDYITIGIKDNKGKQIYSVLYEDGKAYHYTQDSKGNITKGNEYDGDSGGFVEQAVADLNKIGNTKQGARMVNALQNSSEGYNIGNSGNPLTNTYDFRTNSINYSQDAAGLRDGVYFNKSHIKLGHELAHAYDDYRGFDMQSTVMGGLPASEINAVRFENYLRAQDGETRMRTLYSHESNRNPYNIRSILKGSSVSFFNNYITPLGRDEIYKRISPINITNPKVDKTYVKKSVIYGVYNTREQKFISF